MESLTKKEMRSTKSDSNVAKRIVGVIFGIIEIILAFRLVFKLLGANSQNGFVKAIYNITQFFVGIFEGIFANLSTGTNAVFEPATFIAIIVVAIVAWIILILIKPRQTSRMEKTEMTNGIVEPAQQPVQQPPPPQPVQQPPPQPPPQPVQPPPPPQPAPQAQEQLPEDQTTYNDQRKE